MEREEFLKRISEEKLGAVKTIKVINKLMLVCFNNYNLKVYKVDSFKCIQSVQLKLDIANQIYVSGVCLIIELKSAGIKIQSAGCVYEIIFANKTNDESLRINKRLNDNLCLSAGFDSRFVLIDDSGSTLIEGKHNNWVSDGTIMDNYLITVGYDGVIKKWSIPEKKYIACLCMKRGWITTVEKNGDLLYLGNQYGEIYEVSLQDIKKRDGSIGAIWNIMNDKNNVYAVSEDGKIVKYDKEMNLIREIQCSLGWVNAINICDDKMIAVTSLGEIILVDKELKWYKKLKNINMWINNFISVGEKIYAVTAEGRMAIYDLKSTQLKNVKLSQFQLIDIIYESMRNEIVVADVEGNVYFITQDLIQKRVLKFPKCHFTSICLNNTKNNLHIATLEGIVVSISLKNLSYHIKKVSSERIWKIVWEYATRKIVVITTDRKVMLLNEEVTQIWREKECACFPTTCGIFNNKIIIGDDKGQIFSFFAQEFNLCREYMQEVLLQRHKWKCVGRDGIAVKLYIDSSDLNAIIYQKRDETILKRSGVNYEIVDVNSKHVLREKIISNSGWNKFPQIQIKGHFIASASVLPHMFETGTLLEIINNLLC